jgi:Arm DNA-binding domain
MLISPPHPRAPVDQIKQESHHRRSRQRFFNSLLGRGPSLWTRERHEIRNAGPADKEYTIANGQGLSVLVQPNSTKLWLYRYRFGSKRKNMSFGIFPRVGLKAAREAP